MEIILLERIEKLGAIGDVVTVKDGYARNFLLPNKKALRSNKANLEIFEANRERLEKENAERRTEAEKDASSIEGTELVLIRAASNTGQLYGSVTVRDIVKGLNEKEGSEIAKSMVVLEKPIKDLGMHDVKIRLHPEVVVTVKANVARSDDEAELQSQGIDVIAQMFEEEQAEIASNALAPEDELFEEGAAPDDLGTDEGDEAAADTDAREAADASEDGDADEVEEKTE